MVAGLKFLSKKGFNPQNLTNQKQVWEREQEAKQAGQKAAERATELRRERDDQELASARGELPKLSFMYAVPPGLDDKKKAGYDESDAQASGSAKASADDSGNRQPGDDDAAAAFRRMLATHETKRKNDIEAQTEGSGDNSGGNLVLQGTTFDSMEQKDKKEKGPLSALEKAVGRRKDNKNLSLNEQIQRFPALATAPRAKGMTATDIGVSFKPLGAQIRNVRCLACGIWGHSKGDRECQKSGWDPFAAKRPPPLGEDEIANDTNVRSTERIKSHNDTSSYSQADDDSSSGARRKRQKKKHKKRNREEKDKRYLDDDRSDKRRKHKRYGHKSSYKKKSKHYR